MKKLVLSSGHYPGAPGAVNQTYKFNEHEQAEKVVQIMVNLLKGKYEVHLVYGGLTQKVNQVNAIKPDLALDIHFNALNKKTDGCMIMHLPQNPTRKAQADKFSHIVATALQQRDLGGREGWYQQGANAGKVLDYFLSKTNCPSFIPEPGFIDSDGFAKAYLVDGHAKIAQALVSAIDDFFGSK